jgi:hypothetical protein
MLADIKDWMLRPLPLWVQEKHMRITICKGCGNTMMGDDADGKPVCLLCTGISPDSGIPVEIELPYTLHCSTCGKEWSVRDILRKWTTIPFYNHTSQTFYDGCEGWE